VTAGTAAAAVPETAIFSDPLAALPDTEMVPEAEPAAVGEKATGSVVEAPADKVNGSETPLVWKLELLLFS